MEKENRTAWSLFALRLGVFIVMAVWTADKFINPEHAAKVFGNFYLLSNMEHAVLYFVGAIQAAFVLAFMAGYKKRFSYGGVFVMHAISTLSSWKMYLAMKMLFFAAWPMLAACFALYVLRDLDTKFVVDK